MVSDQGPTGVGAGLAADRVAGGSGSPPQVLVLEPARRRLVAAFGATGQTPLAGRAKLSAAQRGTGNGSLRRTRLARLASPRHFGLLGLCLPAAGAAAP